MRVAILVPWRPGDPWRERAWYYCATRWLAMGWPVVTAGADQVGPFSRAAARNAAARVLEWDVAVFADADVFVAGRDQVEPAVELATESGRMVLPFESYTPLTRSETERLLAGRLPGLPIRHSEHHPSVGGVMAVPRALWERVGGFDEGFVGWGFEDSAFHVVAGGALRTPGELRHLWHPASPETDPRHPLHQANRAHALELGYTPP